MTATRQNPDETQSDRIERKVDRICTWIYGNGKDGAAIRIDRLEQRGQSLGKWGTILTVAFATAGLQLVVLWLGK